MRIWIGVLLVGGLAAAQEGPRAPDVDGMVHRLKERLGLSDEQAAKVKEVFAKDGEDRKKLEDARTARMNEILTPEQKAKMDSGGGRGPGGADGGRRGPGQGGFAPPGGDSRGGPRGPNDEDRLKRVMESLRIESADERGAIQDLVGQVLKAQSQLRESSRTSREKLMAMAKSDELSDAAIDDRLRESHEERVKGEKAVRDLQKRLSEVVSSRQEMELVLQGILH